MSYIRYNQPAFDAVMLADWQVVFTLIHAIRISYIEKAFYPLLIMIGGVLCVFAEVLR